MKSEDIKNKVQSSGRINSGGDSRAYATSVSVSPYSKELEFNLEGGVKKLVKALIGKGYLTLSSCEAHTIEDRRNVVIAFKDLATVSKFINDMNKYQFFDTVEFNIFRPESYMEPPESYKEKFRNIYTERLKGNNSKREKLNKDQCVLSLNTLFGRGYDDYVLLELIVSPNVNDLGRSLWTKFKIWSQRIFGRTNSMTRSLTEFVEGELPFYEY